MNVCFVSFLFSPIEARVKFEDLNLRRTKAILAVLDYVVDQLKETTLGRPELQLRLESFAKLIECRKFVYCRVMAAIIWCERSRPLKLPQEKNTIPPRRVLRPCGMVGGHFLPTSGVRNDKIVKNCILDSRQPCIYNVVNLQKKKIERSKPIPFSLVVELIHDGKYCVLTNLVRPVLQRNDLFDGSIETFGKLFKEILLVN